jgi:hypothetical protein
VAVEPTKVRYRPIEVIEAEIEAKHRERSEQEVIDLDTSSSSVYYETQGSPMSDGSIHQDTACESMRQTLLSQTTASQSQPKDGDEFLMPSQPVAKKMRCSKVRQ